MELEKFVFTMNVSDWIALVSLLVAIYALVWTAVTSKKVRSQEIVLNEDQLKKNKEEEILKKQALIMARVCEVEEGSYKVIFFTYTHISSFFRKYTPFFAIIRL